MKSIKSIVLLSFALLTFEVWAAPSGNDRGWLVVAATNGSTQLVDPTHLFGTNYNQSGILETNYVAVCAGGEWGVMRIKASEVLDEMSGTPHAVFALPYWDYPETWRWCFAGSTNGDLDFTNVQAGLTIIRIPAGKAALVGNGYRADYGDYRLAALFGGSELHINQDNWATNANGTTLWGLATGSNWVGNLPNRTVIAGITTTNSWPLSWGGCTWQASGMDQSGGWIPDDYPWPAGCGRLVFNPDPNNEMVFTIRGTCFGSITNTIPSGWSVLSAINGNYGELLGLNFPYDANTVVKRWDSTNSQWITYCATNSLQPGLSPGVWDTNQPGYEPVIEAGEAFLCYQAQAKDWVMAGASEPVFYTPSTSTNFIVSVLSQTSSNLTLALLNSTSNAVYIVESRTNVVSTNWTSVLTNTSTNATSNPLPPISRSGDTLFFRARAQ